MIRYIGFITEHLTKKMRLGEKMKNKLDAMLSRIQLYSYLLPTVKIGNAIMDFREKYTLSGL